MEICQFSPARAFSTGQLVRRRTPLRMKNVPARIPHHRLGGEEPGADMIAMLNDPAAVENDQPVADGVENRLQFALLGSQPDVGGLEFLDLLLHLGIKADFGALQAQQVIEVVLVDMRYI